ncbi:uncharacterized protein LOC111056193 isoform X2 [Nilaparvata lugens]|nr:uncharacterized protein LOC111056193 isoform X2 [Nilaparvata lugens]XP_039292553.1 uncharacterized protein LOC111056193 isoform X2 [Nilaparvata lugens]XP_039292559.1 uncharacterized protein LOC111056193 isoform X2 [Nilaparvata lugens]XP_039292565.1 uncharacterized protein LOC111056193 isoform X2 [Nilaparvata lugens]XP_039292570.1 uncharacterized protein LOC111056193 isoform X2 [Nilaparvata lugens]XP_039292577.1 uncharacterized protein LOC111056193 isoform X2 [Nilaparvata lugens]XP_03929258
MVKSRQKSGKNVGDVKDSMSDHSRDSILIRVYPHLPSISEQKWRNLLQSDDEDNVHYKIMNESCKAAKNHEESQDLSKKAFSFVTMCCHMAWMKIIQMNFMRIDPGEKSEDFEEKWQADTEPLKSPHANDFWPVPNDLIQKNFERLLNISSNSDSDTKSRSESDKDRGDSSLTARLLPNMSEAELHSLKTKLEIPISKYTGSQDYLAAKVSNEQSSLSCDWLRKETTEQIIKLLGPEKSFIKSIDKYPDFIHELTATEQVEKEKIHRDESSSIDSWHRNMEEKVSFFQKLTESERKHFLPYLSLINESLETDQQDEIYFGNC